MPATDEFATILDDRKYAYISVNRDPKLGIIIAKSPEFAKECYELMFKEKPDSVSTTGTSDLHDTATSKKFYQLLLFTKGRLTQDGKIVSTFNSFRKAKSVIEEVQLAYQDFTCEVHVAEEGSCKLFIWPKKIQNA
jgi:hypothetical protein